MAAAARAAGRAWAAMAAKLDERFGADGPSTRRVADLLERIVEIGERLVGAPPEEAAALPEAEAAGTPEATAIRLEAAAATAGPRPIRTREDAIRQIEELAEWFRRTEPHSPLAYTLSDAVRRARMPLPDLLAEILPDESVRSAMLGMLGIRMPGLPGE
jgi:type VI secretion system protein ImpA